MADIDKGSGKTSILGDINPKPEGRSHGPSSGTRESTDDTSSMNGGSGQGSSHHAGSRDVTEGTTGGLGPEVGGTRNYRQGSGATGGDIGNRPE